MRKLGLLPWVWSCCLLVAFAYASPAASYTFTIITDNPVGSFGTGTPVGTSLQFNSPNMSSSASGGGFDFPNYTLTLRIVAGPGETIDEIVIQEIGDILFGGTGTSLTNVFLGMSGSGVVEDSSAPGDLPDVPFNFGGVGDPWFPVSSPASLVTENYALPSGSTTWQSSLLLDIESLVPNATQVVFTLNNQFVTFSEAGSSAYIDKNSVNVNVVPEPATAALLCGGLLALSIRARRQRS